MKQSEPYCSQRRRFLFLTAGVTTAGLTAPALLFREDAEAEQGCKLRKVTRSTYALGSSVSITALHVDEELAHSAIEEAFAELRLVEALMSIYQPESQLSQLNRDKVLKDPHPYFMEVLRAAKRMSQNSHGAFDITVQPLWALFAAARKSGTLPTAEEIKIARRRVNWRQVEIAARQVRLHGGALITLNGIAQGYAADRAEEALGRRGVTQALINTGEISGMGRKEASAPWQVGIQHPRQQDAYLSRVPVAGRCLATSGDYEMSFSADRMHHHLFDPSTGCSPGELSSVSILASTAMEADALSTAVFVLGVERGLELVRKSEGVDALLVLKNGRMLVTDGFPLQS